MTYWHFHAVFILPPLLLLALTGRRLPGKWAQHLGLVVVLALAYTTPWDNYLVYRGVWSYGAERVLGVIGYVPVEEYAFFVLQPLLTGLWFYRLLSRRPADVSRPDGFFPAILGGSLALLLGVAGYALTRAESGLYMGLILVWAMPVIAGQWAYAGRSIWALRRYALPGVLAPTLYLWLADRLAIGLGIWAISERYTLGWRPLGLPVEEAVFFLVTNLLVVQGLILFLYPKDALLTQLSNPSRNAPQAGA